MDVSVLTLLCEQCYRSGADHPDRDWQCVDTLPRVMWSPPDMPLERSLMPIDPPLAFCGTECALSYFHDMARAVVRAALDEDVA